MRADAGARVTDPLMALHWTDDIQLIQGGDAQLEAGHRHREPIAAGVASTIPEDE